jgi:hyperosmotically inducible protein
MTFIHGDMEIMKNITKILTVAFAVAIFSFVDVNGQSFAPRGTAVSDGNVEQQVFKKILNLPRYSVFDFINFKVENGTVVLSGKTYSLGTRRDAVSAVKRIPGVNTVVNNIEELPPSGFDDTIRRQLLNTYSRYSLDRYLHPIRPSVRIVVERGRVTLEGYVANRGDYNSMNILAHGVPGVFKVQNNLVVGEDARR